MKAHANSDRQERKFDRRLWWSFLGAPVVWLIYLQSAYLAAGFACKFGFKNFLHGGAGLFLGLVITVGSISYHQWKSLGGGWPSQITNTSMERRRMMALIGLFQSALFAAIIITSWAAICILNPCHNGSPG
jgi:hypothetical protein